MPRVPTSPVLSQIRAARTYSEKAAALRALKDEVIGHSQRKEWWVQRGILESLVRLLQDDTVRSPARSHGKGHTEARQLSSLSESEVVRLLAFQLLTSFAQGGAAFLGPLHAAGVVSAAISAISPAGSSPQVVLTALRTLSNITTATQLAPRGADDTTGLSDALFCSTSLDAQFAILSQDSSDAVVQEQKRLVASLISRLCKGPQHQNALADSGVLDALATMLASFVVARGEVVPGAEILAEGEGLDAVIPSAAAPGADLALVLEALSSIVANSRFRSHLLLCSPAIVALFPTTDLAFLFAPEARAAWNALELSGFGTIRPRVPGAMDYLLPAVPVPQARTQSSRFTEYPPLGFSLSRDTLASSGRPSTFQFTGWDPSRADVSGEDEDVDEPESPLIPWLIHLVRSTSGLERVMAASLLTSLFKAGLASPEREQALAVLVVPLLCQLMKEHDKETPPSIHQAASIGQDTARDWAIQERTPEVLARLVGDSETLQQTAHECGIIKMAAKLLKDSYDPQPVQSAPRPWSPTPLRGGGLEGEAHVCQLGPPGRVPASAHRIKMRESALKLVAAMATLSNDYRQAIVEADAVPYVVESLLPSPGKPKSAKDKPAAEPGREEEAESRTSSPYGYNPNAVIMAACHVIRALARLPSIVRTTLQDHGVAGPIHALLKHQSTDVQIAASGAVINLVTNCSPMVAPLLEGGIIKTLCDQAHSLNPGLRLNSLWALKHLVTDLDNNRRKQCLEELEPGWLVQLISDDASEEEAAATAAARGWSERRATSADDDEDMDTETAHYNDDGGSNSTWSWPALTRLVAKQQRQSQQQPPAAAYFLRLQQAAPKLAALREAELNPARKARNDSLAIQEQGLGFIRNLIMLPNPANQTDMVDFLFTELGQDRLFGILADKLKVRVVGAFSRRRPQQQHLQHQQRSKNSNNGGSSNNNNSSTNGSNGTAASKSNAATTGNNNNNNNSNTLVLYPQARIVENLTYILVHMAAGVPRHRQLVVAQTDLLRLLGGHFASRDVGVRRALCQLFMNLGCLEGDGDRVPWSHRALELERLGFLAKLEGLERGDADLDVRQRAKAAVAQLKMPAAQ